MAILVTGAAGYIGSHTFYAFQDAGYTDIVCVDDLSTGTRRLLPEDIPFYQGNVGDADFMRKVFTAHKIDSVLHFAGSIIVPESVENPFKYYQNNVVYSIALLELCVEYGVERFIFSSTGSIEDNQQIKISGKGDFLSLKNPYAASKLMIERILNDISHAHGLNYTILRYFNAAGADAEGRTGQISRQATHLIKIVCEAAVGKRDKISIYGTDYETPDGTCIRDYIHVADLATAHLKTYEYMLRRKSCRTFACGYGRGASVLDVLASADKIAGSLVREKAPRRPGDPAILIAKPDGLRDETGWHPQYDDLDLIIASALAWEKTL